MDPNPIIAGQSNDCHANTHIHPGSGAHWASDSDLKTNSHPQWPHGITNDPGTDPTKIPPGSKGDPCDHHFRCNHWIIAGSVWNLRQERTIKPLGLPRQVSCQHDDC
jgi:hypothetical protein